MKKTTAKTPTAKTQPTRRKGSKPLTLLVITTHNLYTENGARSLMRGKTAALQKQGVRVHYFCMRFGGIASGMQARAPVDIVQVGATEQWLRQSQHLLQKLKAALSTTQPDWVLVSGIWLCLWGDRLGRVIKNGGARISFDMQGPVEEIAEYQSVFGSRWLAKMLALWLAWAEHRFLARWADLVETVSHNALDYLRYRRARFTGKVCLVHCGFEKAFSERQHARYRQKWRQKWRKTLLRDETRPAIVFAGTLSGWQNKPALFAFARKNREANIVFFVPPHHHAEIEALGLAHVHADFLPSDALQQALCAFDYGLMTRQDDGIANSFSFPLKVSEYANARLGILTTARKASWRQGVLAKACLNLEACMDLEACSRSKKSFVLSHSALQTLTFDHMVKDLIACYRASA